MAKKTAAPTVAASSPAPDVKQIQIDQAEFVRTRDAVVTSWTRLHGALQGAIQAYIDHSNSVLGGQNALTHSGLNVLVNLATAPAPTLPSPHDDPVLAIEDDESKPRKRKARAPKDPNAPKRPITAYLQFLQEERPAIQKSLSEGGENGQKRGDISIEGTNRWKALSDDEREKYKAVYKQKYQEYLKAMEAYRATNPDAQVEPEAEHVDGEEPPPKKKRGRKSKAEIAAAAAAAEAAAPPPATTASAAPAASPSSPEVSSPEPSDTDSSSDSDSSDSEAEAPAPTPAKAKGTKIPSKLVGARPTSSAVNASAAALASTSSAAKTKKSKPSAATAPTPAAPATSSPSKKRKGDAGDATAPATGAKSKKRKSLSGGPAPAVPSTPSPAPATPAVSASAAADKDKKERKRKRKSGVAPSAE